MTPYWQIGCDSFQVCNLLQIYLAAPVSSATAERSFSTLRRTKTWLRSNQGQERLSSLASMQIEREILSEIKIQDIVSKFAAKAERRL